jgi:hypothetical protein
VVEPVHPLLKVAFTVYVMVDEGVEVTVEPTVDDKAVDGLHE